MRSIEPQRAGFRINAGTSGSINSSAVVIATQSHVAAALLEGVDAAAADSAAAIEAPPLAVVFLGYTRRQVAHPLDGIGYLTPSCEQRALTGALFCSTMFEGRAPEGHVALAAYVGGARAPTLALRPSDDLIRIVESEFADILGAKGRAAVSALRVWPRGLPQYNTGHRTLATVLRGVHDRVRGLFVTGNYLRGVSIAACLEQATEIADRVDGFLLRSAGKAGYACRELEST